MSRTDAKELKRDIVRTEQQDYEELQRQFAEGEISEQEYEQGVENLLESGDEFLDYEETTTDKARDTGRSLKQKLSYYSLPIFVLAPIVAVILLPGLSPMLAVTAGVPLAMVGLVLWGYLKIKGHI